jgi:L-aspartate oxidase
VQFHPTALCVPGQPAFLLSEALRGEGARLVDEASRDVVDPLLPRDAVARAIHAHLQQRGRVFIDLRHLDPVRTQSRFAALASRLRQLGLSLTDDLLPVAPAAHYCMGGVRTDTWGRSDVAGLYVAGEAACTGAQGANRLASNSLLECLVFGARAADAALSDVSTTAARWSTHDLAVPPVPEVDGTSEPASVAALLDAELGVERNGPGLRAVLDRLPDPRDDTPDAVLIATLVARAAWLRAESRGAHFRRDAPHTHAAWRGRIHWRIASGPRFEEVT